MMKRPFSARPLAHHSLGVLLLITLLVLLGCGGSPTPEAEIPPTSTLIPTLPPPPATPVPAEPSATPEAVATEAPAEVETTEEVTATEEVTETEEVTPAEEVTATEAVSETAEVTATEEVTTSEEATATTEVTATHEISEGHAHTEAAGTEAITATEEISPSAEVSATEEAGFESASNVSLSFAQPTDNAVVPITFTVAFAVAGVEADAAAGHVHLLIDSDFIEAGQAMPDDELHHHFDDDSTSTELSLGAGSHILRLQYAGDNHIALEGEQYRKEIVVNVVDSAAEEAVRIVSPSSGAIVPPTFNVILAATGLTIAPAGEVSAGSGHLHLLIDAPYIAAGETIPVDDTHIHLGKGQLTSTLTLEPGTYLLRVQFADGAHRALAGEQYRAETQIVVEEGAPAEQVMFVKPGDDATVTSPFLVGWAASGLIIETAGRSIRPEGGHLHLLIDQDFVAAGGVIPMDETHLHFGKGQTSTELTLEPGEYTLRLQMANGGHIAQEGAIYRDEITITVK